MTPGAFLATSGLLGLMVLAAGAYGLGYTASQLKRSRRWALAAAAAYAVLAIDAAVLIAATPLTPGWKILVGASALAYLGIPPLTWRYLQRTHDQKGAHA